MMLQSKDYKPRVYFASKLKHSENWKTWGIDKVGNSIEVVGRWIHFVNEELNAHCTNAQYRVHWAMDIIDVKRADALICYGESDDELRGALVETGVALACGIPVFVVGKSPSFGTWQNHPGIFHAASVLEAVQAIKRLICE